MHFKQIGISLIVAIATVVICSDALSQPSTAKRSKLDDGYGDAFLDYQPYVVPGQKPETEQKPEPTAPSATPKPKEEKQVVDVEWLRRNYRVLEDKAIDNPNDDNVNAYLYTKRIVLDKSQRFSEAVFRVMTTDPFLNENNRIPQASAGARSVRAADTLAQEQAVRELASQGGLIFFLDGSCRFCAMQAPVIQALKSNYNMEFLVVSLDGSIPSKYSGPYVKDNGLYGKLGLKLTPSIVYVPKPKSYKAGADPNQYLIVAQGFYAQDELVKQIAFAGFKTKLLAENTRRDLDVWNRGVASTDDLRSLELNPEKPETFKSTLQPILAKQYR